MEYPPLPICLEESSEDSMDYLPSKEQIEDECRRIKLEAVIRRRYMDEDSLSQITAKINKKFCPTIQTLKFSQDYWFYVNSNRSWDDTVKEYEGNWDEDN